MKKIILSITFLFIAGISYAQLNIVLRSNKTYPTNLANIGSYVDHFGNEYALVGTGTGLDIVDVTNPDAPVSKFTVPGPSSVWREVKTYRGYAFVTTEDGIIGLQIINLNNLPASITTKTWKGDGAILNQLNTIHALHIDTAKAMLYLYGSDIATGASSNGYPLFINIADPWNPTYAGRFVVPSGNPYVHDGYVENDTAYFCHIYSPGFVSIVDVSDKLNPVELATISTPQEFPHNSWLSDNHKVLFTTDEVPNSVVAAYDISDLGNITLLSKFQTDAGSNSVAHNVHILNDYAVTSWYTEGVVITDESRPRNPIEVGHYDTYPASNGGDYEGDWGVDPFLPSGNLLVSDMQNGLFVLTPTYKRGCYLEGVVTDSITGNTIYNATILFFASPTITKYSDLSGEFRTGTVNAGTYSAQFSKPGYQTKTITGISLSNGILTSLNVQLVPLPLFAFTGMVTDSATGAPVPNAKVNLTDGFNDFNSTCDASGNFSMPVYQGTYTITAGKWGYKTKCASQFIDNTSGSFSIAIPRGYYDDFSLDFGWTVSGTSLNKWERAVPIGTYRNTSQIINPAVDVSTDCGAKCFVTDNGGGDYNDNDVDNGSTILASPVFDATIYTNPSVDYYRWFIDVGGNQTGNDTMKIKLSNGSTTVTLETILRNSGGNGAWVHKAYNIASNITLTSTMRMILEIADSPGDNAVEGGFDKFQVTGALNTGVNDLKTESIGTIYADANPFSEMTTLNYFLNPASNNSPNKIFVFDMLGKIEEQFLLENTSGKISLGKNFPAGIYFVYLESSNGKSKTLKLVKAN